MPKQLTGGFRPDMSMFVAVLSAASYVFHMSNVTKPSCRQSFPESSLTPSGIAPWHAVAVSPKSWCQQMAADIVATR